MRGGSPLDLILLAHMPGSRREERRIQIELRPERRHGEWFEDGPAVRAWIDRALQHPQAFPREAVPRTIKADNAARVVVRETGLSEPEAFELLRDRRDIVNAVDRGRFSQASYLIAEAIQTFAVNQPPRP